MHRLFITAIFFGFIGPVNAQSLRGSVSGVISEPSGTPARQVPIQIRNIGTEAIARKFTAADGGYQFTDLPSGTYELTIIMPCCAYQTYVQRLDVPADKAVKQDIQLRETVNGQTLGDDPARLAAVMRKRQKIPARSVPRIAGRKPDLSGVWLVNEDPFPEYPRLQPWAAEQMAKRIEQNNKDHPHTRCLPGSAPIPGSSVPFIAKFVQTPSLLVILFEDVPGFRQVFLDHRAHPPNLEFTWMGHSIGRWDDDTLVVETVGFNDKSLIGPAQGFVDHTDQLHMIERYRRVDFSHLEAKVTYDDPGAFTKPWNLNMTWDLAPQEELLEYVCENNKPQHMVGK